MPVLDCSVKTCYNNKNSQCCLNGIKVEGSHADTSSSTLCASFEKRAEDSFSNSYKTERDPQTVLDIDCKAHKCVFNESSKCHAAHIGIAGNGAKVDEQTECASFYKD